MRNMMRILTGMVLVLALVASATASSVKYDYDRTVDFSKWSTVAWRDSWRADASMSARRIEKALAEGFVERGYAFVEEPDDADFILTYRVSTWQDVRLETIHRGPAWGRTVRVDREAVGALIVEVHDRRTGRLAWHGTVSDALARDPDEADRRTGKAVRKLLAKFPERAEAKDVPTP